MRAVGNGQDGKPSDRWVYGKTAACLVAETDYAGVFSPSRRTFARIADRPRHVTPAATEISFRADGLNWTLAARRRTFAFVPVPSHIATMPYHRFRVGQTVVAPSGV